MHCIIGRVNDMPTLPTGEEGDSMERMVGPIRFARGTLPVAGRIRRIRQRE